MPVPSATTAGLFSSGRNIRKLDWKLYCSSTSALTKKSIENKLIKTNLSKCFILISKIGVAVAQFRRGQHPQIISVAHRPAHAGMMLWIHPFTKNRPNRNKDNNHANKPIHHCRQRTSETQKRKFRRAPNHCCEHWKAGRLAASSPARRRAGV